MDGLRISHDDNRWTVEVDDVPEARTVHAELERALTDALQRVVGMLATRHVLQADLLSVARGLVEALNDRLDVVAAQQALAEPGASMPLDDLKDELGL